MFVKVVKVVTSWIIKENMKTHDPLNINCKKITDCEEILKIILFTPDPISFLTFLKTSSFLSLSFL